MNYENLISIVMPVFNAQAYLEEALESVRRQTWTDWELLVVDDHSTDGSAGLVSEICRKDARIRLLSQTDGVKGAANARNFGTAHANGVKVIASNHDFHKTPAKEEIVSRLRKMQDLGADIPKIAVMPQNKKDVLTLLAATEEMASEYADRPIITMSMSGTGVISRLCGEVFGSALTFGAVGKVSAPGQMGIEDLTTVLGLLHKSLF